MDKEQRREERRRISEEKKLAQSKLQGKVESEEFNPCLKEHHLSTKCMAENNYKENRCQIYFENYKSCKQFWFSVQLERRRNGIVPEFPTAEEREKIRADHMKNIHEN